MSKRTYQVMDCLRSLDLRSGNFVPSARTRIGGSNDGDVDYGHDCKSIYEYDNFGLLWVKQEPGVDSPYNDYVFHPGADEIELTVEGECIMRYADGEGGPLVPGVCTYIPAGVPHGNHHPGIEDVVLLVFYPKPISQVGRGDHKMGEPYTGGKKHEMINFYEAPAQEIAPGHFVTELCKGHGIRAAYHRLAPGCSVPVRDFITKDSDEIVFVFRGTGLAVYPDKSYAMRRHIAFYNTPHTPYRYWNNSDSDLQLIVLHAADIDKEIKTETRSFQWE